MHGTVQTIHPTFFFIRTQADGEETKDWFAHHLALRDGLTMTDLHLGMEVQFVPEINAPKGPRAVIVGRKDTSNIEDLLG